MCSHDHFFTITQYDPAARWIVIATKHSSVELADEVNFHEWAREEYPGPDVRVMRLPGPPPD